jgi:hypothetical protein
MRRNLHPAVEEALDHTARPAVPPAVTVRSGLRASRLSVRVVLACGTILGSSIGFTRAGTITVGDLPATGTDAATDISPSNTYLCCLSFGKGMGVGSINNVPFQHLQLLNTTIVTNGIEVNHGGTYSLKANHNLASAHNHAASSQADGNTAVMLRGVGYVADGAPAGSWLIQDYGGLNPGVRYSLRLYYRRWDNTGVRALNVFFNGEGTNQAYSANPLDEDSGGAHYLEYNFTARSSDVFVCMTNLNADESALLYGMTLQRANLNANESTLLKSPSLQPAPTAAAALHPVLGVGSWIWDRTTTNHQYCRLWKSFEIPRSATVESARLRITVDNEYRLYLDEREIGHGAELGTLTTYDVTALLAPGVHVLGVDAYNDYDIAGVLLGLRVELTDGGVVEVGTDETWRIVPEGESGWLRMTRPSAWWPAAKVIAEAGKGRWGGKFRFYNAPPLEALRIPIWRAGWFLIALASVCAVAIGTCLYLLGRLVMQSQAQQIVQRERERIARDIHDELTGGLTQLVLLGETAQSELPPESNASPHLKEVSEGARALLRVLNETIWVVNSRRDTLPDLASYVCKYAETFLQSTQVRCRFDVEQDLPPAPCALGMRRNLLLGVKEALNNVAKHSGATEVCLRVHRAGPRVIVSVEDNGRGFDPASADRERNGLLNLAKRAADAGGECRILSAPGGGCCVQFNVPLAGPRRYRPQWFGRKEARLAPQLSMSMVARSGAASTSKEASK